MRLFILILLVVLAVFQYDLWLGKNGYMDYKTVQQEIETHKAENIKLSQRNQVVIAEINDLKDGFNAAQERARWQYELIKPNETFYRIINEK
ncbi:MAG: cell division protein FtsB [Lonepinella koalarum]|nr:cell division protein FtsB [Lonepinella koalarum]